MRARNRSGYIIWEDVVMFGFFGLLGLIVLVGLGGVVASVCFSLATRQARFDCEQKNMEAVQKDFSTKVACRARNLGGDTLHVHEFVK